MQGTSLNSSKSLTLTLSVFITVFGIVLYSCKGDDGIIGPAGPKGDAGTANVIYSEWTIGKLFNDSTVDGSVMNVCHVTAPKITTDVLNKGDIRVYFNYGAGTTPMPYTGNAGGKASTMNFWPKVGQIIPYRFTHDNTNSVKLGAQIQYRYIIIPGGVAARVDGRGLPDFSDYDAVCEYYGIPK